MANYWNGPGCLWTRDYKEILRGEEIPDGAISAERLRALAGKGKVVSRGAAPGISVPVAAPVARPVPLAPAVPRAYESSPAIPAPVKRGPGRPPKAGPKEKF